MPIAQEVARDIPASIISWFVNKARCWPIFDDEEVSMQIAVKRTNVDLPLIFAALCIFSVLGKEHRCNSSRRIYAHQLV